MDQGTPSSTQVLRRIVEEQGSALVAGLREWRREVRRQRSARNGDTRQLKAAQAGVPSEPVWMAPILEPNVETEAPLPDVEVVDDAEVVEVVEEPAESRHVDLGAPADESHVEASPRPPVATAEPQITSAAFSAPIPEAAARWILGSPPAAGDPATTGNPGSGQSTPTYGGGGSDLTNTTAVSVSTAGQEETGSPRTREAISRWTIDDRYAVHNPARPGDANPTQWPLESKSPGATRWVVGAVPPGKASESAPGLLAPPSLGHSHPNRHGPGAVAALVPAVPAKARERRSFRPLPRRRDRRPASSLPPIASAPWLPSASLPFSPPAAGSVIPQATAALPSKPALAEHDGAGARATTGP